MTKLEIAKAIRDNGYSCYHIGFACFQCPLLHGQCGCSVKDHYRHSVRIRLIDDYIAKHEKETTMTELEKLEKVIEENRKAGEELKRKFEEYKNREKIVFDGNTNWGLIIDEKRYILSSNDSTHTKVEWKDFYDCESACTGTHYSGQKAIDEALARGYKVVKLTRGPEAVAKFLLGED